jgi:hypothetical protein
MGHLEKHRAPAVRRMTTLIGTLAGVRTTSSDRRTKPDSPTTRADQDINKRG